MEGNNDSNGMEPEIKLSPYPIDAAAGTSNHPNPSADGYQTDSVEQGQDPADESHRRDERLDLKIRFGPWSNIIDSGIIQISKDQAWEHLVSKSQRNDDEILQEYSDAIRNDLSERLSNDRHTMLIKDGCFFLQLALLILGCHKELGFRNDHSTFGIDFMKGNKEIWIENMFTVDNQIPIVILKQLLARIFFNGIVNEQRKWTPTPSSLAEKALYELLVLPVLKKVQNNQPASDILQGLRILLIGGQNLPLEEDFDVEANLDGGNVNADGTAASIDVSATNLKRSTICIKKVESGGIRGIDFCNYWILTRVYLPTFSLDATTEKILHNLMLYERQKFTNHQQREVSSYIKLMNGIVRRKRDAKLLADRKIILCDTGDVEKLPDILKKLVTSASSSPHEIVLTPQLQTVRGRIRDHSPMHTHCWRVFTLIVFLTVLQVVTGILQLVLPYLKHHSK